jgi:hypothetical protein
MALPLSGELSPPFPAFCFEPELSEESDEGEESLCSSLSSGDEMDDLTDECLHAIQSLATEVSKPSLLLVARSTFLKINTDLSSKLEPWAYLWRGIEVCLTNMRGPNGKRRSPMEAVRCMDSVYLRQSKGVRPNKVTVKGLETLLQQIEQQLCSVFADERVYQEQAEAHFENWMSFPKAFQWNGKSNLPPFLSDETFLLTGLGKHLSFVSELIEERSRENNTISPFQQHVRLSFINETSARLTSLYTKGDGSVEEKEGEDGIDISGLIIEKAMEKVYGSKLLTEILRYSARVSQTWSRICCDLDALCSTVESLQKGVQRDLGLKQLAVRTHPAYHQANASAKEARLKVVGLEHRLRLLVAKGDPERKEVESKLQALRVNHKALEKERLECYKRAFAPYRQQIQRLHQWDSVLTCWKDKVLPPMATQLNDWGSWFQMEPLERTQLFQEESKVPSDSDS